MNIDRQIYIENMSTPDPNSGCWLWTGATDTRGYGSLTYKMKRHQAHRHYWLAYNGEIPKGMNINHKCDVACCVNPDHLYVGTQQENMQDKIGKHPREWQYGDKSPRRKLTSKDAEIIQNRYDKGETPKLIHKDYTFVGYSTITACCIRQNWSKLQ